MKKLVILATALLVSTSSAFAEWPERPITLIVPWSAGGGTDVVARVLAAGLEGQLGQRVNVVNLIGGSGVIGHSAMVHAAPDGYTLGMPSPDITTYYWTGMAEFKATDVTPIALVNADPASFIVSVNSEWDDLGEALEAIKASEQGQYKMMGSPPGGGYHLAIAGLFEDQGIDPNRVTLVPTQGASASMQELAAGGVDIVYSSLPEGRAMIEAGRAKPLAILADKRSAVFPDVPTVEEAIDAPIAGGSWRGLIAPKGLPEDVLARLDEATQAVVNSPEFIEFLAKGGFTERSLNAEEFGNFLNEQSERNAALVKLLGLSTRG